MQRVSGMNFQVAGAWFTGCTCTRLPPPGMNSACGTDPVVQFLQTMPYGAVARSLEAKMQRLLLLSTADDALLLMQWSERRSSVVTGSGNLVLLDQLQMPSPVLQFLRREPSEETRASLERGTRLTHRGRLLRAFPWESEQLLPPVSAVEGSPRRGNGNEASTDKDGRSTGGCKGVGNSDEVNKQPQTGPTGGAAERHVGSLSTDFSSYGLAIVEKDSGRVLSSLRDLRLQRSENKKKDKLDEHFLAVTPLPSNPGVLASIVSKQSHNHRVIFSSCRVLPVLFSA